LHNRRADFRVALDRAIRSRLTGDGNWSADDTPLDVTGVVSLHGRSGIAGARRTGQNANRGISRGLFSKTCAARAARCWAALVGSALARFRR